MSISRRDLYAMGEPFGDSATQRKAGGGRIYGGGGSGGGGGGGNQTSTTVQDLPDWAKPYAKEGLGKAAALTDTNRIPTKHTMALGRLTLRICRIKPLLALKTWAPLRLWALRQTWRALRV
jgi:hypothetical protein